MNPKDERDEHENDVIMPGFRFHPTEEELIEFYLRRKVQGKRFNVDLIALLDLYRYDPWELPALASIGEKEWYFYVPRDKKYRNGDRPNRVTTSGYWKATGADRMIRSENYRSIGLKKTLVFYVGKAPKGIRTSWIMNEYRLPYQETKQYQKTEISLCRVYKRPGLEDHSFLSTPAVNPSATKAAESNRKLGLNNQETLNSQSLRHLQLPSASELEKLHCGSSSSYNFAEDELSLQFHKAYGAATVGFPSMEEDRTPLNQPKQSASSFPSSNLLLPLPPPPPPPPIIVADELPRVLDYQQMYNYQTSQLLPSTGSQMLFPTLSKQTNLMPAFSDKLWEWNPLLDATKENNAFK